jgi:chaperonin GroEL (HSP60 family)
MKMHILTLTHTHTQGFRMAIAKTLEVMDRIEIKCPVDPLAKRDLLMKCGMTALNSKLVEAQKEFFADMLVTAVQP